MLGDAGAAVLVTQPALLERLPTLPAGRAPLVRLDADWPAIARQPDAAPALVLDPRHPAYVIYTSGSTGTQKASSSQHGQTSPTMLLRSHDLRRCAAAAISAVCHRSPSTARSPVRSGRLLSGGTLVLSSDLSADAAICSDRTAWRELLPR